MASSAPITHSGYQDFRSDKEETFPPPPLLRTVRDSFPAHRSSISKALLDEETRIVTRMLHDTHIEPSPATETGVDAPANDTTALCTVAAICFPTLNGLLYFLVTRHLMEVCSLSREAKFDPLSNPLRAGFRFLHHPLPAAPSACLTARFPIGRASGLPCSMCVPEWVRSRLFTGDTSSAVDESTASTLDHLPFGSGLSASLACFTSRCLAAIHIG